MRRVHPLLSPFGLVFTVVIFLGLGIAYVWQGGLMFSPGKLTEKSRFELKIKGYGTHAEFEGECHLCHAPLQSLQGDLCIRCHEEIGSQLESQTGLHSKFEWAIQCFTCHSDHNGPDFDPTMEALSYFDHNAANFSLVQHRVDYSEGAIECAVCHGFENGFTFFRDSCATCHGEEDMVFMERHALDFGPDCLSCHDGVDRITQFDHSSSNFPLLGNHKEVACVECHQNGQFADTLQDCASCHAEPVIHSNLFSPDCATPPKVGIL